MVQSSRRISKAFRAQFFKLCKSWLKHRSAEGRWSANNVLKCGVCESRWVLLSLHIYSIPQSFCRANGQMICEAQEHSCLISSASSFVVKPTTEFQWWGRRHLLCERYHTNIAYGNFLVVGELHLWYKRLRRLRKYPTSPLEALKTCPSFLFPVIQKLLQIMATLPVMTLTSERSFSRVFFNSETPKTYLCNTTGVLRLNKLALLNVHREVSVSANEILDEQATKPRRLDFKLW